MVRWPGVIALVFVLTIGTGMVLGTPAVASDLDGQRTASAAGTEATQFDGAPNTAATEREGLLATPEEFSRTTHRLTVYPNGSIKWTNRHTRSLDNESEQAAYETFADEFNSEETELYTQFRETASQLTGLGADATGRSMNASNFERRAYVAETGDSGFTLGTQGVVEMSFMWSNFTEQSSEQLRIGDVFANGLSLGSDRRLVIEASDELQFVEVDPDPDSTSRSNLTTSETIIWSGEREFGPYRPLVRLALSSPGPTTPSSTDTTAPPTTTANAPGGAGGGRSLSLWVPIGVVVLIVTGGAGGVWYLLRRSPPSHAESTASGTTETATEPEPVEPEALLSDADRVKSLLEDHGGRMRQSAIVEATDWSKSKVSMLLSEMEDDDEITKLRVGRENIVSLPGHEPDAAASPFEDGE